MVRAITRAIPDSFNSAISLAPRTTSIDVALAREQHAAYRAALAACGAQVETLAADEACPDCVFVEDTAVIADGVALITRPGAASRRTETAAVENALAGLEIVHMTEPATLDGGDCMRLGDAIYVGKSARTNAAGIAQLAAAFPRLRVIRVDLPPGVLHLKCVVTPLGGSAVLLAQGTLDPSLFVGPFVWVPREEAYAANVLAIDDQVIVAEGFPRTHKSLVAAGFPIHPVPISEVRKADGALTCQALIV